MIGCASITHDGVFIHAPAHEAICYDSSITYVPAMDSPEFHFDLLPNASAMRTGHDDRFFRTPRHNVWQYTRGRETGRRRHLPTKKQLAIAG